MRHWLGKLRKDKGLTQAYVAREAFIDRSYYAQIESGKRDPSYEVSAKISNVLGFHPAVFYSDSISEPFNSALDNSPVIVAQCDLNLRYTWLFNSHSDFSNEEAIGKRDDELAVNKGTADLMELKQQVISTKRSARKIITFPLSNGQISYDVYCKPLLGEDGSVIGAATISTELSGYYTEK
ncbi:MULTISPECIES: helix-turn-helix domain-containing protein [Fictibacillus]|uniref:helix-turn-helix domain-containing protein n=1 Tax=Fictibacillus TaxID=1329200 RepID=UPI001011C37F|nr:MULTISPECIES: helix-turn-helix domain-containing protein [Fictibacillus]MDM5198323.1 helix-turn-helix domain-containing protein [Fictibacillus enclensis]RXY99756.1 transcriptional regulator [Fictibacillus sp. S7]